VATVLAAVAVAACAKSVDDRESAEVDFSNPKRVLSSVFYAAKTGKADHLESLCDPRGTANEFAARICAETPGGDDWPAFVEQFRSAHLIGEARISGDRALVNFAFGPDGKETETMELVRRDGRWYLKSF
jgi:hypothetical protein